MHQWTSNVVQFHRSHKFNAVFTSRNLSVSEVARKKERSFLQLRHFLKGHLPLRCQQQLKCFQKFEANCRVDSVHFLRFSWSRTSALETTIRTSNYACQKSEEITWRVSAFQCQQPLLVYMSFEESMGQEKILVVHSRVKTNRTGNNGPTVCVSQNLQVSSNRFLHKARWLVGRKFAQVCNILYDVIIRFLHQQPWDRKFSPKTLCLISCRRARHRERSSWSLGRPSLIHTASSCNFSSWIFLCTPVSNLHQEGWGWKSASDRIPRQKKKGTEKGRHSAWHL